MDLKHIVGMSFIVLWSIVLQRALSEPLAFGLPADVAAGAWVTVRYRAPSAKLSEQNQKTRCCDHAVKIRSLLELKVFFLNAKSNSGGASFLPGKIVSILKSHQPILHTLLIELDRLDWHWPASKLAAALELPSPQLVVDALDAWPAHVLVIEFVRARETSGALDWVEY
jgi:hypothetical protein